MLTAIRQWVIRTMLKSKGQTGVVQTLPKKDLIELNTQITAQRLMQGGIEPNSLKTADQVENAVMAIERRNETMSIGEARGSGIRSTSSAKVFDMEGKEIKNPENIMAGKEVENTTGSLMSVPNKKGLAGMEYETKKGPKSLKQREKEILESMEKNNKDAVKRIKNKNIVKDAIDNASPGFVRGDRKYNAQLVAEDLADKKFGKEFYDLDQKQQMDLYGEALDGLDDSDKFAQGGRAGFRSGSGKGIMEFFKNMMKPKKTKGFDERRFREGPIDLDFLGEIKPRDLEKFIRTRDTKGIGSYGMYENFADMPAGLRAAELISTIKGTANKINYKAAELFLGKKLRGDETVDELLQVLNRQEMRADGGRIGYKDGPDMGRRTFLKILGGLAAVPIIGKFIKPLKTAKGVAKVPIIQTAPVKGKPEWFDALVNKVIIEGDDVTKKFATKEREIVHSKDLGDGTTVRVTQDIDDGAVRVEYESEQNVFGDNVQLEYKKPLPDEGDPNPAAEFTTAESGPVGRQSGPDDFDIDVDEVGGSSISDLDSDVSKLKEYATGKKLTIKEILQSKKRKDKARAITEDPEAQSDAVISRQGDYDPSDYDDYASGGIARMLGE